jgi:hypothetical protein
MSYFIIGGTNVMVGQMSYFIIGGTNVGVGQLSGGTNVGRTNVGRTNVGGTFVSGTKVAPPAETDSNNQLILISEWTKELCRINLGVCQIGLI